MKPITSQELRHMVETFGELTDPEEDSPDGMRFERVICMALERWANDLEIKEALKTVNTPMRTKVGSIVRVCLDGHDDSFAPAWVQAAHVQVSSVNHKQNTIDVCFFYSEKRGMKGVPYMKSVRSWILVKE